MKKGLKVTGIVVSGLLVFGAGSFVGASSDWKTTAINNSYSEMLDVASNKTNQLTVNVSGDIDGKIQTEINGTVEENKAELERLLQEYYQMKLNGLTQTQEFADLETQIETIRNNILVSYKQQIDQAFANNGVQ